jgi:hypothetical protein
VVAGGEREQYLPDRGRAARGPQDVVERAAQRLRRAADEKAEGVVRHAHAGIIGIERLEI